MITRLSLPLAAAPGWACAATTPRTIPGTFAEWAAPAAAVRASTADKADQTGPASAWKAVRRLSPA
jgi:hypothetical protein